MSDSVWHVTGLTTDAFNDYGVYYPEDKYLVMSGSFDSANALIERTKDVFSRMYVVRVQIERVEA
jgi:hypothetical protein